MINFNLHPKQTFVLETEATEILYGGAAGGGKSHLLRVIAILLCLHIPNLQVYLFRRLRPDLLANHLDGESGFRNILSHFNASVFEDEIRFPNGAKIHLCHCQHEKDRYKYQGAEIHVLLIDELTHFTDIIYRFLRNRVRMPPKIPDVIKQIFGEDFTLPKIICGSNPGNVGHTFVKHTFVDMVKPFEVKRMPPEEGGMLRQYIPALLEDNPSLMLNDPGYEQRLEGLGSPDLVKAMRYGLWDITAGAALEKLRRDKHMLRDFEVPQEWTKFMVIDWGSSKPFSVAWYCVVDDNLRLKAKDEWPERLIPKGALIRYREYYGWNGKANEGCRLESAVVANQILSMEEDAGEEMDYRVGDAAMWAEHDGPSVQQKMYDGTGGRFLMERSRKGRAGNFEEIRSRIVGDDDGPMLYITVGCKHFWRTVPDLQLDERDPTKGPDTEQEDHCFVAGTKVITKNGPENIENIKTGTLVLTTNGFKPCHQLGVRTTQKTYRLYTSVLIYEATGNHPFLTSEGTYVRLDALCTSQKLYQIQSKFSLIRVIGCVVSIFNAVVLDCIVKFGSIIMKRFLKVIMFIIKIITAPIMSLKILNLYPKVNICRFIQELQRLESIKKNKLNISRNWLKHGIKQKKERNSIVNMARSLKPQNMIKNVNIALKHSKQSFQKHYFAAQIALQKAGGVTIQDIIPIEGSKEIYNLHVPGTNNYTLEGGVVVHNCYDDLQYGCASRPYITTKRDRLETAIKEAKRLVRKNS